MMLSSAVFFAVVTVVAIFLLGFIVAWLLFKTIEYAIKPQAETHRPDKEPDTAANLRLEVERTRLNAEALRLRTEEVRLKALEAQVGARTGGHQNDTRGTSNSD